MLSLSGFGRAFFSRLPNNLMRYVVRSFPKAEVRRVSAFAVASPTLPCAACIAKYLDKALAICRSWHGQFERHHI